MSIGMADAKKIFIVDDNDGTRTVFSNILKLKGYQVDTAVDGLEAVEKLATNSYDLTMLDVMIPTIDGFGVLATIKERGFFDHAGVVVMCTNLLGEKLVNEAKSLGAKEVFCKTDFSAKVLLDTVGNYL
jgi:CheY-like chemotaxis protein